jgi:deoxyribose-phosphate aldolase
VKEVRRKLDIGRMTADDVARMLDYAILDPAAAEAEYVRGCATTRRYRFAAYHVLPTRLALVVEEMGGYARENLIELGAPIAFPYGSTPTAVKLNEAEQLIRIGATALDMVANVGWLKDRRYDLYERECAAHVDLCHAAGINAKIIIEVGYLGDEEVVAATGMVVGAGADYVKTATGKGPSGFPDHRQVALILDALETAHASTGLKVSGLSAPRVRNAYAFIQMGAGRIGTSSAPEIVDALPEMQLVSLSGGSSAETAPGSSPGAPGWG